MTVVFAIKRLFISAVPSWMQMASWRVERFFWYHLSLLGYSDFRSSLNMFSASLKINKILIITLLIYNFRYTPVSTGNSISCLIYATLYR